MNGTHHGDREGRGRPRAVGQTRNTKMGQWICKSVPSFLHSLLSSSSGFRIALWAEVAEQEQRCVCEEPAALGKSQGVSAVLEWSEVSTEDKVC